MKSEEGKKRTRQPYEKPRLRAIELVADEVLAIGCKTPTAPDAPLGVNCPSAGCKEAGS